MRRFVLSCCLIAAVASREALGGLTQEPSEQARGPAPMLYFVFEKKLHSFRIGQSLPGNPQPFEILGLEPFELWFVETEMTKSGSKITANLRYRKTGRRLFGEFFRCGEKSSVFYVSWQGGFLNHVQREDGTTMRVNEVCRR